MTNRPLYNNARLRKLYNRFARDYDRVEGVLNWLLGIAGKRRRWLMQATPPLLEIGAGTGLGMDAYRGLSPIVLTDLSENMLARAKRRAKWRRVPVTLMQADAAHLPFPDHSFSTVVSSLTLCTLPDPVAAVREMARVCEPGGSLLFVEHGRSHRHDWLNTFLDNGAKRHYHTLGCRWNQDIPELLREADIEIKTERRSHLGLIVRIHAWPCPPPEHRPAHHPCDDRPTA